MLINSLFFISTLFMPPAFVENITYSQQKNVCEVFSRTQDIKAHTYTKLFEHLAVVNHFELCTHKGISEVYILSNIFSRQGIHYFTKRQVIENPNTKKWEFVDSGLPYGATSVFMCYGNDACDAMSNYVETIQVSIGTFKQVVLTIEDFMANTECNGTSFTIKVCEMLKRSKEIFEIKKIELSGLRTEDRSYIYYLTFSVNNAEILQSAFDLENGEITFFSLDQIVE